VAQALACAQASKGDGPNLAATGAVHPPIPGLPGIGS